MWMTVPPPAGYSKQLMWQQQKHVADWLFLLAMVFILLLIDSSVD